MSLNGLLGVDTQQQVGVSRRVLRARQFRRLTSVSLLGFFLGLWLGGHRTEALPIRDFGLLLAIGGAAAGAMWSSKRRAIVFSVTGCVIIFVAAWAYASVQANHAFNECVQHGEKVRVALADFRAKNGRYPNTLSQLNMDLPGKLTLPPHLLRYNPGTDGYMLAFSDWLVSFQATASAEFMASK